MSQSSSWSRHPWQKYCWKYLHHLTSASRPGRSSPDCGVGGLGNFMFHVLPGVSGSPSVTVVVLKITAFFFFFACPALIRDPILGWFSCFSVCMDLLVTSPVIREECVLQERTKRSTTQGLIPFHNFGIRKMRTRWWVFTVCVHHSGAQTFLELCRRRSLSVFERKSVKLSSITSINASFDEVLQAFTITPLTGKPSGGLMVRTLRWHKRWHIQRPQICLLLMEVDLRLSEIVVYTAAVSSGGLKTVV